LLKQLAYSLLATLVLALVGLNVLVWSGRLVEEDAPAPGNETTVAAEPPPAPTSAGPPDAQPRQRTVVRKLRTKPQRPSGTTVLLTASRGDCWVEVRDGSPSGKALYIGTLATGNSLRFNRPKLWLRLGAASHVDLVVNGRPSTVPPGTVEFAVPDA
jgi:hypothetical protein